MKGQLRYRRLPQGRAQPVGRSSQEQYRSDEDLYTLLSLVGMLILAVGLACILVSIYEWIREVIRTW
jgi:hypothetical protein